MTLDAWRTVREGLKVLMLQDIARWYDTEKPTPRDPSSEQNTEIAYALDLLNHAVDLLDALRPVVSEAAYRLMDEACSKLENIGMIVEDAIKANRHVQAVK